MRQALEQQEQEALALDRHLMAYETLKRNAEVDREMYDVLMTRLKETDIAGQLETNNLRLVDDARVPSRPFRPARRATLLRGAAAGIVLGLLMVGVLHLADDRIRWQLFNRMGVRTLAIIPDIREDVACRRARVVVEDPESPAAESFRRLRAGLMLSREGAAARRILVTGVGMGDGKSLVAINLALSFATNGKRTLLVDGDLRRPSARRSFWPEGCHDLPALSRETEPAKAIVPSSVANLDILAAEAAVADPSDFLASGPFRGLLESGFKAYDRVIVDCPPLLGLSDALLLLPYVDGVIAVARFQRTRHRSMRDAIESLRDGDTPLMGLVLNGVNRLEHGYYYGSYYGGHYGKEESLGDRVRELFPEIVTAQKVWDRVRRQRLAWNAWWRNMRKHRRGRSDGNAAPGA